MPATDTSTDRPRTAKGRETRRRIVEAASDLMVEVLGERGTHARTTVGVAHLPLNALAEVEAVFLVSF